MRGDDPSDPQAGQPVGFGETAGDDDLRVSTPPRPRLGPPGPRQGGNLHVVGEHHHSLVTAVQQRPGDEEVGLGGAGGHQDMLGPSGVVQAGDQGAQFLAAVGVTVPQLLAGQHFANPGVVDQGGEGDGVNPAVGQIELDGRLPRRLIPLHLEALNLHGRSPYSRRGLFRRPFPVSTSSGSLERTLLRNCPVYEWDSAATSSGGPSATICPPSSPPSGPRSMIQSAVLMTSRLCSMTTTVLPASTRRCRTLSSRSTSAKCRPTVGSSKMYRVRPVSRRDSSVASLTRCASPPDRVVAGWPSWT